MIKDLFKDIAKYLPAQIVPAIVGIISIPIITRLFPPTEYGNYILVTAAVSVLATIVGWLPMSIIRFYPAYEQDGNLSEFYTNIIELTIISILGISVLLSVVLLIIRMHISAQIYSLMWIGMAVFVLTSFFNVLQHFIRSKRQVTSYSGFTIWQSITAPGFGILLIVVFCLGVEGLLWGTVLSLAIIFPLLYKRAIGNISLTARKISVSLTKEMARYGFPLVVGNLAAWLLSFSDRYVLEFFRGSQEVGIYSASYAVSVRSIWVLASLFLLASGPIGMEIWEKEGEKKSREFVSQLTRYYLIVCIPGVVGISVLAKPLMSLLTGQQYLEGYKIIPFVTLSVLFLGLQQRFQAAFIYYKRTGFITFSIVTSGLINLGLNFLVVPSYGYMGAAVTTLISYTLLLILMIIVSRQLFIWEFPFASLGKVACASAIMGVIVYHVGNSLTSSAITNSILGICLGALVYLALLLLLREFKPSEIRAILNLKTEFCK